METASQVSENFHINANPSLELREKNPETASKCKSNDLMDVKIEGLDAGEKRNTSQNCQTTDLPINELSSEHVQGELRETVVVGSEPEDRCHTTASSITKESSQGEKVVLGVHMETTTETSNRQNCQAMEPCNNEPSFEHVGTKPMETGNAGSDGDLVMEEGACEKSEIVPIFVGAPTEMTTAGSDTKDQTMVSCSNVLCFESVQGQPMEMDILGSGEPEKCVSGVSTPKENSLGGKPEHDSKLVHGMETGISGSDLQISQTMAPSDNGIGSEHVQGEPMETKSVGSDSVDVGVNSEHLIVLGSNTVDIGELSTPPMCGAENSNGPGHKEVSVSSKSRKRKSVLTSPETVRVLRPRLNGLCKTPEPSIVLTNTTAEREKKRKKRKRAQNELDNEFSKIRKRVRYLLSRMGYEHNYIDAYSGDGWKGQSVEKIKPEKELQRAASEILRCKRRIRELFQQLDSLCAEGRFQETLFDSEGQISSEDIFCAKCRSEDLSPDNDIILCDGVCDRGFHQKCLEPPLLKEEIPPEDEGWLCPGCDCKVDCFDLLNDSQGTNLSVEDTWEKVFPEAAVREAGDAMDAIDGLPSDDSEDDEYNPDASEMEERVLSEGSSSDESEDSDDSDSSDSVSASDSDADELAKPSNDDQYLGLPSDDSEDDDYDPTAPDAEQTKEESSDSDATSSSDSEYLSAESDHNESEEAKSKKPSLQSEVSPIPDPDSQGDNLIISEKRQRERLDYKKLHDEEYGNLPSDSSDDEDFIADDSPNKKDGLGEGPPSTPEADSQKKNTKRSQKKGSKETPSTSKGRKSKKNVSEDANRSTAETHVDTAETDASKKSPTTSADKIHEPAVTKGRKNKKNVSEDANKSAAETHVGTPEPDPTASMDKVLEPAVTKEESSLSPKEDTQTIMAGKIIKCQGKSGSKETGSSSSKRRTRQTKESADEMLVDSPEPDTTEKRRPSTYKPLGQAVTQKMYDSFKQNEYPTRATKETLAKELGLTFQQVDKWFGNARRSLRRSNNANSASPTKDQPELPKSENKQVSGEETTPKASDNVDKGEASSPTPFKDREIVISIPTSPPKTGTTGSAGKKGRKTKPVVPPESQIQTRSRRSLGAGDK